MIDLGNSKSGLKYHTNTARLGDIWLDQNDKRWRLVEMSHRWKSGTRYLFEPRDGNSSDWAMYDSFTQKMTGNTDSLPVQNYVLCYTAALDLVGQKLPDGWDTDPPHNIVVTEDKNHQLDGRITLIVENGIIIRA